MDRVSVLSPFPPSFTSSPPFSLSLSIAFFSSSPILFAVHHLASDLSSFPSFFALLNPLSPRLPPPYLHFLFPFPTSLSFGWKRRERERDGAVTNRGDVQRPINNLEEIISHATHCSCSLLLLSLWQTKSLLKILCFYPPVFSIYPPKKWPKVKQWNQPEEPIGSTSWETKPPQHKYAQPSKVWGHVEMSLFLKALFLFMKITLNNHKYSLHS